MPLVKRLSAGDWFTIGFGTTVSFGTGRNIYAAVNDTFYSNNAGAFNVTVRPLQAGVPEPASIALLGIALLAVGRAKGRVRR